ncbi:MAG TPA: hypothetical protein VF132_01300 [Rudaea sp.]
MLHDNIGSPGFEGAALSGLAPYRQDAELGPPSDGSGNNYFGNSIATACDTGGHCRAVVGAPGDDNGGGAVYVFELDPDEGTWHQTARIANITDGEEFGTAVAMDGDTIAVGAPRRHHGASDGAVDVYVRSASGSWAYQTSLNAPGNLGVSVALSGDTLAAGAPYAGSGYVYVFKGSGSTWTFVGSPFPPDLPADARFGYSIALNQNRLLIGAPHDSLLAADRGSAYVFAFQAATATWQFEQKLEAFLDGAASDTFGYAVALEGETTVIGAPGRAGGGAVHSFTRNAVLGLWTYNPTLLPSGAVRSFGVSVTLHEGHLAVGGWDPAKSDPTAYVYSGSAATWALQATLVSRMHLFSSGYAYYSLAFARESLLSGAHCAVRTFSCVGQVDFFLPSGSGWKEAAPIAAISDSNGITFGASVALSNNTAVVWAPEQSNALSTNGAASIYVRDPQSNTWPLQARVPAAAAYCTGACVAVDGDTLLVGLPDAKVGSNLRQGAVAVYQRSGTSWNSAGTLADLSGHADDHFGSAIALSGNLAVVGATDIDGTGGVYVFSRGAGGAWSLLRKLQVPDAKPGDNVGSSVAISGSTVLAGAPLANNARGGVYVFDVSSANPVKKLTASDGNDFDFFGYSVALSGTTAIVGAPKKTLGPYTGAGAAYVFTGSGVSWSEFTLWGSSSVKKDGEFGQTVAIDGAVAAVGEGGGSKLHVFLRRQNAWIAHADMHSDIDDSTAVAISGQSLIFGAPNSEHSGRAYILSDSDIIFANDFD